MKDDFDDKQLVGQVSQPQHQACLEYSRKLVVSCIDSACEYSYYSLHCFLGDVPTLRKTGEMVIEL